MSKAAGRGGKAKTTLKPVQPVSQDDSASASEESVQVVSPPSISLRSPPAVPHLIYDNQPNRVGSKSSNDKPLGRFFPSPNKTFLNLEAQQRFDELHSQQMMSPLTLVRRDVPTRQSPILTPMSFSKKAKLEHKIAIRPMASMGQTAALQACFNKLFNREEFMKDMVEKAKETKWSSKSERWSKN